MVVFHPPERGVHDDFGWLRSSVQLFATSKKNILRSPKRRGFHGFHIIKSLRFMVGSWDLHLEDSHLPTANTNVKAQAHVAHSWRTNKPKKKTRNQNRLCPAVLTIISVFRCSLQIYKMYQNVGKSPKSVNFVTSPFWEQTNHCHTEFLTLHHRWHVLCRTGAVACGFRYSRHKPCSNSSTGKRDMAGWLNGCA